MNLKRLFAERLIQFSHTTHDREVQKEYDTVVFGEPLFDDNMKATENYLSSFVNLIDYFIGMPT